jgi:hypothetical protein
MTYTFRSRFCIPASVYIEHDGPELVLRDGDARRVSIVPVAAGQAVMHAHELVIHGIGYVSVQDATEDGGRWIDAMTLGFMAVFLPANFGSRARRHGLNQGALDALRVARHGAVYRDVPGLLVVSEEPKAMFVRTLGASVLVGRNAELTIKAIQQAYNAKMLVDTRVLLAFDMYAAAETMPPDDPDARFLMLMIAVEALIKREGIPKHQESAIDQLLVSLETIENLDPDDVCSLRSRLNQLRLESIGSAGRRLARSLGEQTYLGLSPEGFFRKCYTVRSELVHGNPKRPDPDTIRHLIGPLIQFVGDLIRQNASPY